MGLLTQSAFDEAAAGGQIWAFSTRCMAHPAQLRAVRIDLVVMMEVGNRGCPHSACTAGTGRRRRAVGERGRRLQAASLLLSPPVVLGLPELSNVESMTVGTGSFESYQEIITRGSLRGKMVLASARLSLSRLV